MAVTVKITQAGTWVAPTVKTRSSSLSVPNSSNRDITVSCNAGEVAVGAGYSWNGETNTNLVVADMYPVGDPPTGWYFQARNAKGSGGSTLTCYVVCVSA